MRDVPASMTAAWAQGHMIGDQRPIARVTVQHPNMRLHNFALHSTFRYKKASEIKDVDYDQIIDPDHGMKVNQTYANFLFSKLDKPMELPNVTKVEWNRNLDSDVADCTITLVNTRQPANDEEVLDGEFDQPGYYSYARGATKFSRSRWGQEMNPWFGILMPDNLIRTYEGYGSDLTQPPELDPFLVQTGVWIIDDVTTGADSSMTIKCRDIGRILMDQMFYEPVVPKEFYDLGFRNWDETFPISETDTVKLIAEDSSNTVWLGSGTVAGHKVSQAFDGNPNSYWLSIGNVAPSKRYAYEWVQALANNQSIDSVEVRTKKKGYVAYVSIMVDGKWQGDTKVIDYHEDGVGKNGANIEYVATAPIPSEKPVTIKLDKTYTKVQRVRVTLGNLQNFRFGPYLYRGGIRDIKAYGTAKGSTKLTKGPAGANPGRYSDYTDIVKLLCAWGGFYWPKDGKQRICNPPGYAPRATNVPNFDDTKDVQPGRGDSSVLGKKVRGRVWGDFQQSGTTGFLALDAEDFDKKSLMDCIVYVRDILGFIFFIDETGGVQWRLPNVTNKGNMVSTISRKPGYKKGLIHFVADTGHIMKLDSTISAANVRELFFVGDNAGKVSGFAPGFNPNPTGLRRIAGWTDAGFAPETDDKGNSTKAQVNFAKQQAALMADMLSLRQLFTYRVNKFQIPAYPAIQIDDQIRLSERVTSDGYIHYIQGISSSLDMTEGTWTYDLETHWLGFDPASKWLFHPEQLKPVSQKYVEARSADQLTAGYQASYSRSLED